MAEGDWVVKGGRMAARHNRSAARSSSGQSRELPLSFFPVPRCPAVSLLSSASLFLDYFLSALDLVSKRAHARASAAAPRTAGCKLRLGCEIPVRVAHTLRV
jgi:hypothetical protein